jgi:hypothetical protein
MSRTRRTSRCHKVASDQDKLPERTTGFEPATLTLARVWEWSTASVWSVERHRFPLPVRVVRRVRHVPVFVGERVPLQRRRSGPGPHVGWAAVLRSVLGVRTRNPSRHPIRSSLRFNRGTLARPAEQSRIPAIQSDRQPRMASALEGLLDLTSHREPIGSRQRFSDVLGRAGSLDEWCQACVLLRADAHPSRSRRIFAATS